MRSPKKLDTIDLRILKELNKNPQSTLTDIASKTSISRPTITSHLKDLNESGMLLYQAGPSLRAMSFVTALVALEVKHEDSRRNSEKYLSECPRVKMIFRTTGKANLQVLCWGEDEGTLYATIDDFRNMPDTDVVSILYLGRPIYGDLVLDFSKEISEESPCGKLICKECKTYEKGDCMGCPATPDYIGPLKAEK
jgi:DNA-binding Lrp family transcriptional regulator